MFKVPFNLTLLSWFSGGKFVDRTIMEPRFYSFPFWRQSLATVWDILMCVQLIKWALYSGSIGYLPNYSNLFDSSIWIMTTGLPSLGIRCKIGACQATSLHFRAILMRTLRDAIPSKNMVLEESFWAHFQRIWTCRCSDSLLPSKNDPLRSDFISPHRLHFLSIQSYLLSQNNPFHPFLWLGINTLRVFVGKQ